MSLSFTMIRAAVAAVLGAVSVVAWAMSGASGSQPEPGGRARVEQPWHGSESWVEVGSDAGAPAEVREGVVRLVLDALSVAEPIRDHEGLAASVASFVASIAGRDGRSYFDAMSEAGLRLDRRQAEARFEEFRRWKFLPDDEALPEDDAELFAALWHVAYFHPGAEIERVDIGRIGLARTLHAGADARWPYGGSRGSQSCFDPASGPLRQDAADEIEETDRGVCIDIPVALSGGARGCLRVVLWYSSLDGAWCPGGVVCGFDGSATDWPWVMN